MGVPSPKTASARLWGDQEVQHTILRALHHPFVRALAAGDLPRCAPAWLPLVAALKEAGQTVVQAALEGPPCP